MRSLVAAAVLSTISITGCGKVASEDVDAAPPVEEPVDAGAPDGPLPDAPLPQIDCRHLHDQNPAAPSGKYTIDPDGFAKDPPFEVYCDMTSAGGGWTVVFAPGSLNYKVKDLAYTSSSATLLSLSTFALVAYRHSDMSAYPKFASFPLPFSWKEKSPFTYPSESLDLEVKVDGEDVAKRTLRFGWRNFASLCADEFHNADGTMSELDKVPYGRICILGTTAPYFSGFADTRPDDGGADFCTSSEKAYSAAPCTANLRFSIAVR